MKHSRTTFIIDSLKIFHITNKKPHERKHTIQYNYCLRILFVESLDTNEPLRIYRA